jgi:predicted flap endonuclease-1-like 5' DNA nuclease
MSTTGETSRSRGMMMIAAYRADRLNQRPLLRKDLQQARAAARQARRAGAPDGVADPAGAREAAAPGSAGCCGHGGTTDATAPPSRAAVGAQRPPDAIDRGSVFADLVSVTLIDTPSETSPAAANASVQTRVAVSPGPADPQPPLACGPQGAAPEPAAPDNEGPGRAPAPHSAPASDAPSRDIPLAELGFGPGMRIRLRQLGLHSMSDLAHANATELRAALGDISRLVDVERWISDARRLSLGATTMALPTNP